jgi:hypothetical protein
MPEKKELKPEEKELALLTMGRAAVLAIRRLSPRTKVAMPPDPVTKELREVLSNDIWETVQKAVEQRSADIASRLRGSASVTSELYRMLDDVKLLDAMIPGGNVANIRKENRGRARELIQDIFDALTGFKNSIDSLNDMLDETE